MTKEQINAELRLFKSYTDDKLLYVVPEIQLETLKYGILMTQQAPINIQEVAISMYGKKPEQWNATFHKSFEKVLNAPIEVLLVEQLVHYFTTYGFEDLGIYNSEMVYIPYEKLEIPELKENVPLVVINKITELELGNKLLELITSGIALSSQTINDIMLLSDYIPRDKFDDIKNREIKIALYDKYGVVPSNNIEFLRYLIYKTTESTLLINNDDMFKCIKNAPISYALICLENYVAKPNGYEKLAEIYLRYKELFMAFKRDKGDSYGKRINKIINRISKLADKYHKPMNINILDNITSLDSLKDVLYNMGIIIQELDKITPFREIRILNAINMEKQHLTSSRVYKIRNGKSWVTSKDSVDSKYEAMDKLYEIVEHHLCERLRPKLQGKTVYIPKEVDYAAPTSEKQFMGNVPEGTFVEIPRTDDMVVGIHWYNLPDYKIDLDLHAMSRNEHYGWNSMYRSEHGDIAFSGDVVDACGEYGASEVFIIRNTCGNKEFLLSVNDFRATPVTVPFELVVGYRNGATINKNYIIDPNNIVMSVPCKFDRDCGVSNCKNEQTLGYVMVGENSIRFYFNDFALTKSRAAVGGELTKHIFNYLDAYTKTQISLTNILRNSGATMLDKPEVEKLEEVKMLNLDGNLEKLYRKVLVKCDYDLSLNCIDKTSLIKLFNEV